MSRDFNGVDPSSDHTVALIAINAAVITSETVNMVLNRLLGVVSSDETGHPEMDESLKSVRDELDYIVATRAEEEKQITSLLKSVLDREVLQYLQQEIKNRVDESIDETVAQLVERQIDEHIPKSLREKIDRQQRELDSYHIQIHNAEACRQNGVIQTRKHVREPVRHLLDENGMKSSLFPETVSELLGLNDRQLLQLVKFYGMNNPDKKSRSGNINWFLQFSGVAFQYVHD